MDQLVTQGSPETFTMLPTTERGFRCLHPKPPRSPFLHIFTWPSLEAKDTILDQEMHHPTALDHDNNLCYIAALPALLLACSDPTLMATTTMAAKAKTFKGMGHPPAQLSVIVDARRRIGGAS